jgi:hypothetical protein
LKGNSIHRPQDVGFKHLKGSHLMLEPPSDRNNIFAAAAKAKRLQKETRELLSTARALRKEERQLTEKLRRKVKKLKKLKQEVKKQR